jgi:ubiquitin-conjugating enzyme E2 Q
MADLESDSNDGTLGISKCIMCGDILEFASNKPSICGEQLCYMQMEEYDGDDFVSETIHANEKVAEFIISISIIAMKSNRREWIFEPYPTYFVGNKIGKNDSRKEMIARIYNTRGSLAALNKDSEPIIKDWNRIDMAVGILENKLSTIMKMKYDLDIMAIDKNMYMLLRFILYSNKLNLLCVDPIEIPESADKKVRVEQYSIKHSGSVETAFVEYGRSISKIKGKRSYYYMFHGSSAENWASICRNGLKSMSGTKLMTAGAVYGAGIYLSDTFALSQGYARSYNSKFIIVGVFEVNCPVNKDSYKQTTNIFVCPDEKAVLLRYLIVIPANAYSNNMVMYLDDKFGDKLLMGHIKAAENAQKASSRRIMQEILDIKKNEEKIRVVDGLQFIIDDEDISNWKANMDIESFDHDSGIYKDCKEFGVKYIQFEVIIPARYPFEPPFVRVISPRFATMTGYITSGGSVCFELLVQGGWVAVTKIAPMLVSIKANICEGRARLDPTRWNVNYNLTEAVEAFDRMVKSHPEWGNKKK